MTVNEMIARLSVLRDEGAGDVEVVVRDADTGKAFAVRADSFHRDQRGRVALAHNYSEMDFSDECDVPGFY